MARKDRDAVNEGLGQIFGSDRNDMLRNVIQSDRERSGRNNLTENDSSEVVNATSSEVAKKQSSGNSRATSSEVVNAPELEVAHQTSSEVANATTLSSVEGAILELLDKPFLVDPLKGPFTVSTLKIPTAISERLGWVSTLTGKPKQEIVAEALKLYFEGLSNSKNQKNKR